MNKKILIFVSFLVLALALVGCGSAATPVPQPTMPPVVITVVITTTPLPVTATPIPPTITPIPTVGATLTQSVASSSSSLSTSSRSAAAPTATRRATAVTPVVVVPPTFTPVPNKYGAPELIGPVLDESLGRRDSRNSSQDIVFTWRSVQPLGQNECYVIRVDVTPGQGDQFLFCDLNQTQKGAGAEVQFVLFRPTIGSPNFSSLMPSNINTQSMSWSVYVAHDDGPGGIPSTGAFYAADNQRHKVTPLSPTSRTYKFPFSGGQ